jgi:hypothetical protein
MILRTAVVVVAAALVASAAPAKETPRAGSAPRECFQLAAVSGYSHAKGNRVYISTGPSETYLFQTMGPCPDLDWAENIGLDPATAGPICTGLDVDLIVPSTIGPRRCPVSMIRKLAPGEKPGR